MISLAKIERELTKELGKRQSNREELIRQRNAIQAQLDNVFLEAVMNVFRRVLPRIKE